MPSTVATATFSFITTEKEKAQVQSEKILVFKSEEDLPDLVNKAKRVLQGKEAYEKIVVGIDPGEVVGLAVLGDGKVIEEGNCFSTKELIDTILKIIRNVDFDVTNVSVKMGNGVPIYKELLEGLDSALPLQVVLELVSEAGTNKPLKENKRSREVRHITSAKRIAGRVGNIIPRSKTIAAHNRIQQNDVS